MVETTPSRQRLEACLRELAPIAVAVSGGVDSMTLGVVAHRLLDGGARLYHAVSAAVPPEATARVRAYGRREGWALEVIDAGEFADRRYRDNPVDRCFHCKTHLYGAMARRTTAVLVSGTNVDDLGDYRPGLRAAADHGVRHPYVEAGMDKDSVRALARALALDDLAELPAAPCLSSRIETGIVIDPAVLGIVNQVERALRTALAPRTVRCRVRREAVVVELDEAALARVRAGTRCVLVDDIAARFAAIGVRRPVLFHPYRMGSAFLQPSGDDGDD